MPLDFELLAKEYEGRPRYYRRDGTPYTGENAMMEWGKDFGDMELKIVKQETLWNGLFISTVWLGLDHSWAMTGKPLIFETMVFTASSNFDKDMDRYSTEAEALAGHAAMVKEWRWAIGLFGYVFKWWR